MPDNREKLYTRQFILMALANFFVITSYGTFYMFPLFINSHGGSKTDIGIIMGVAALSSVLFRPCVSRLIDIVGRRKGYTIACLGMAAFGLSYLLFDGDLSEFYMPLLFVRVLHGIVVALYFTSGYTYVADIIPSSRLTEGVGMFGATGLTGMAIGPVIAEAVIKSAGFPTLFVTSALIAVTGTLTHLPLPESYVASGREKGTRFFSLLSKKRTRTVAALSMLFGLGLAASTNFVAPFAEEMNLPLISLYFISYSASAVLVRVFGGTLADRFGEIKVLPYSLIFTASGFFSLILLQGNCALLMAGLLVGCGTGLLFPCLNGLAVRHEPIQDRSKATAIFTGAIDSGLFLGSIALGVIGEWGGYKMLFLVAGLGILSGLCTKRNVKG